MLVLTFVIDALATYRLTRLLIEDEILRTPRVAILELLESETIGPESKLAYFLQCPWCMGFWCAILVLCARRACPKVWSNLALVLALSATTGLIAERENG